MTYDPKRYNEYVMACVFPLRVALEQGISKPCPDDLRRLETENMPLLAISGPPEKMRELHWHKSRMTMTDAERIVVDVAQEDVDAAHRDMVERVTQNFLGTS